MEKVQEIGLAAAITLLLVNCDRKSCRRCTHSSSQSISSALCKRAFLSSKGQASVKSCLQSVETKEALYLDTMQYSSPEAHKTHTIDLQRLKPSHLRLHSCSSL